jgi:hypothetical protein
MTRSKALFEVPRPHIPVSGSDRQFPVHRIYSTASAEITRRMRASRAEGDRVSGGIEGVGEIRIEIGESAG